MTLLCLCGVTLYLVTHTGNVYSSSNCLFWQHDLVRFLWFSIGAQSSKIFNSLVIVSVWFTSHSVSSLFQWQHSVAKIRTYCLVTTICHNSCGFVQEQSAAKVTLTVDCFRLVCQGT